MAINNKLKKKLKEFIYDGDLLAIEAISYNDWKVVIIDDKYISENAVNNLSRSILSMGIHAYYSLPIRDLYTENENSNLKQYSSVEPNWADFYDIDENGRVDELEDCIFFSAPLKFLLLRTGDVRHTIYAGPKDFLQSATGISFSNQSAICIGSNWFDDRIENLYQPQKVKAIPSRIA